MLIFQDSRLLLVCLICALVNLLTSTTGAARVSGVLTHRIATSISVYNLFQMITRLANLLYVPIMGSIVDLAVQSGDLNLLLVKMRYVVVFATLGCLAGFLMLPTFVEYYTKAIQGMEKSGSMLKVVFSLFLPRNFIKLLLSFRRPSLLGLNNLSLKELPKSFLIFNVFMVGIWTIGVLSATLASAMVPSLARTATLLSGIVNGFATVMFTLIVDPTAAVITDQAVAEKRTLEQVKIMVVYLTLGNIAGTVLAQAFLLPGANFIAWVTRLLG